MAYFILLLSSIYYYSYWKLEYTFVIIVSILVNYYGAKLFDRKNKAKLYLILLISLNLLVLGYFKYTNFIIENFNYIFSLKIKKKNIELPLAISFFTFQQIAFLVDRYKKIVGNVKLRDYFLFVTFFPQLIAGPIVHHSEMMPQFKKKINFLFLNVGKGLLIFSIGLFKKVVIADSLSKWVAMVFDTSEGLAMFEAWGGALAYTFQIYFDFSGYSDMAIGTALIFNIQLPFNFNSPYKAKNIQQFWRRWHMTLSRFLRDYIYIPLGGNRLGKNRTSINLFMTFFIGGVWHGASWMFIIWGVLHGLATSIHKFCESKIKFKVPSIASYAINFIFLVITWVFFRANSIDDATRVLEAMFFGSTTTNVTYMPDCGLLLSYVFLLGLFLFCFFLPNTNKLSALKTIRVGHVVIFITSFLFAYSFLSSDSEFLYFRF